MATISSSPPDVSSSLSSLDTSYTKDARRLIEEYQEKNPSERTAQILPAFLDHVPSDGQHNVAEDIRNTTDLRELADHYVSAILVPSMFFPFYFPTPFHLLTT